MEIITPRASDLGDGLVVRRVLPNMARRAVGPFVFFDQMGPLHLDPGRGMDVRPHPHIGLATITYLFDGEILHRDSLGSVTAIQPGAVNWMTAGHGIVHSERTPPATRAAGSNLWGLQLWVALPLDLEACDPAFAHYDAADIPQVARDGMRLRVVLGSAYGLTSPVKVSSPMFMVDVLLSAGARLDLEQHHAERAAYVVDGTVRAGAAQLAVGAGHMLTFEAGEAAAIEAINGAAHVVLVGGAALDAPRFIWWNFVSSSKERIEEAKARWAAQAFPAVPGESEFIPLPPSHPSQG